MDLHYIIKHSPVVNYKVCGNLREIKVHNLLDNVEVIKANMVDDGVDVDFMRVITVNYRMLTIKEPPIGIVVCCSISVMLDYELQLIEMPSYEAVKLRLNEVHKKVVEIIMAIFRVNGKVKTSGKRLH